MHWSQEKYCQKINNLSTEGCPYTFWNRRWTPSTVSWFWYTFLCAQSSTCFRKALLGSKNHHQELVAADSDYNNFTGQHWCSRILLCITSFCPGDKQAGSACPSAPHINLGNNWTMFLEDSQHTTHFNLMWSDRSHKSGAARGCAVEALTLWKLFILE